MEEFLCKVCGGDLQFISGEHMKCEYCGQIYDIDFNQVSNEQVYNKASALSKGGTIEENKEAYELFDSILSYRNSAEKAQECINDIEHLKVLEEEKQLEDRRQKEIERERAVEQEYVNKKKKRIWNIILVCLGIILIGIFVSEISKQEQLDEQYAEAFILLNDGQIEQALEIFKSLDGFKESETYVTNLSEKVKEYEVSYKEALTRFDAKDYESALSMFKNHIKYKDSLQYIHSCSKEIYAEAEYLYSIGNFESAKLKLENIPEYADSHQKKIEFQAKIEDAILLNEYNRAVSLYEAKSYEDAQEIFLKLGKYQDAIEYLMMIGDEVYQLAEKEYRAGNYAECSNLLNMVDELNEWDNYSSALKLYEKAKEDYTKFVETKAMDILREKGYNKFAQYVDDSINVLYSSNEADELKKKWKPTLFSSLEVFQSEVHGVGAMGFRYDTSVEDNIGGMHENVLLGGPATYSYYINGKFDKLSGCAFILGEEKSTRNTLYLMVYGDDALLYKLELNAGELPIDFSVDIKDVNILKIYFDGYDDSWSNKVSDYGAIGELILFNIP